MKTAVQAVAESALSKRQMNSIRALQHKVETTPAMYTRVSPAQFKAMQQAFDAVKASGVPIPPEMLVHAKNIGLR